MTALNTLKLISLNIEQDSHYDRFLPLILKEKPDVVLLQEVFEQDLPFLQAKMGMKSAFTGLNWMHHKNKLMQLGNATFSASTVKVLKHSPFYYRLDANSLPLIKQGEPEKMGRAILVSEVQKENQLYCLINTHFTWSPNGKPNEAQYQDLKLLLARLEQIPEFILCGDFNAPRGTDIFDTLAKKYKDNIPKNITTTIDKNLHVAGDLNLVVDGLFTTPAFQVGAINIVDNMSDHCAIVAGITKNCAHTFC